MIDNNLIPLIHNTSRAGNQLRFQNRLSLTSNRLKSTEVISQSMQETAPI